MSEETLNIYDTFRQSILLGGDNLTAVNYKLGLVDSGYVPNMETDEFWSEVAGFEVTGQGYDPGGRVCNTPVVRMVNGLITFDLSDPFIWLENPNGFAGVSRAVLYIATDVATTSRLVAYSDAFETPRGNRENSYAIAFGSSGVFTIPR